MLIVVVMCLIAAVERPVDAIWLFVPVSVENSGDRILWEQAGGLRVDRTAYVLL